MYGCHCVGPQGSHPLCPCHMKNLVKLNGRWVRIIDHGPVKEEHTSLGELFRMRDAHDTFWKDWEHEHTYRKK